MSPGRSNRMFRGRPGDVGRRRPQDVLGTNICWLGADCGIKKSRFVKEQEAKGSLSNLGIKTPLSKIPLLNVLF